MDELTAHEVADLSGAEVADVRAVVEWFGDREDAIPADLAETVRGVLDPDGHRSAFHRMSEEESLRWSAVEYLEKGDRAALRRIADACGAEIAHALSMDAAIGGLPAGAEWAAKVDAWFAEVVDAPRFGITSPALSRPATS
ncbi:hypothetical protein Psed_6085 [Pseudonocardia dioxanivorans CB1190]|uniref:Uncharacterized protein n=1 Tax=Pseudonocardia dioxanivorans (strain ATCC 55486 / DSM 44775 / JCM 13855 / CB1190) TaxID=675635 RepID=F4CLQ8_PSEUX|nr:hypothetical protein [Pseudonocardia dioxanivorans]AEA28190.1 hypothetical protein Psed_6085 [Pseudonocardia dioxanivorans CB1190]